jgi:hypothetical protein
MFNVTKNIGTRTSRTVRITTLITGMLFIGCTHNVAVQPIPDLSKTYTDKIKTKTLLIITDNLSNYVYKGAGSTRVFRGLPDTWVFPVGQPTSDLLRKGVPKIFDEVEVATETPSGNDLKGKTYGLILKPSIEFFNFYVRHLDNEGLDWVVVQYKIEVLDLKGRMVFHKTVMGRGESKVTDFSADAFFGRGNISLSRAADYAVQNGVNLLLESLYESKEVREYRE